MRRRPLGTPTHQRLGSRSGQVLRCARSGPEPANRQRTPSALSRRLAAPSLHIAPESSLRVPARSAPQSSLYSGTAGPYAVPQAGTTSPFWLAWSLAGSENRQPPDERSVITPCCGVHAPRDASSRDVERFSRRDAPLMSLGRMSIATAFALGLTAAA